MATARQCSACHVPARESLCKHKPGKAKDVLDIRIVPGDSNAWVECYENTYDRDARVGNAELNARMENMKLQQHLSEKEEKLKTFQEEVKKRVTHLQKLKRQEEQRKALKMIEDEHNLVLQRTLGIRVPCQGNMADIAMLNKELLKSCIIPCNNDKQLLRNKVEESDQKVKEIAEEIKKENMKARSKLVSRKLDRYVVELPGGQWNSPALKQNGGSVLDNGMCENDDDCCEAGNHDNDGGIDQQNEVNDDEDADNVVDDDDKSDDDIEDNDNGSGDDEESEDDDDLEISMSDEDPEDDNWIGKNSIESSYGVHKKNKQTLPLEEPLESEETLNKQTMEVIGEVFVSQNRLNYLLDLDKDIETEKVQKRNQFWKYRKLFMEIERDQVKEGKKLEDHRRRVRRLKLVKEEERKSAEKKISQFTEKLLLPNNNKENMKKEVQKHVRNVKEVKEQRTEMEMYRYMEALRKVAKERIKFCNVTIPPLCSCGPSFWDSHPDKCANNCIFHKNIKVYVSALTSALANTR